MHLLPLVERGQWAEVTPANERRKLRASRRARSRDDVRRATRDGGVEHRHIHFTQHASVGLLWGGQTKTLLDSHLQLHGKLMNALARHCCCRLACKRVFSNGKSKYADFSVAHKN